MQTLIATSLTLVILVSAGCAGNPNSSLARQCDNGLSVAYQELDFARAKGFGGTVEYSKAASLLGAAKTRRGEDSIRIRQVSELHRQGASRPRLYCQIPGRRLIAACGAEGEG